MARRTPFAARVLTVLSAGAGLLVLPGAAAVAAPSTTPPFYAVVLEGVAAPPHPFPNQTLVRYDRSEGGTVSLSAASANGVNLTTEQLGSGSARVLYTPPTGQQVTAGTFPLASTASSTNATLATSLCSTWSYVESGSATVNTVTYTGSTVTTLSLSFTANCTDYASRPYTVHGEVRYGTADTYGAALGRRTDYGDVGRGQSTTKQVAVYNRGNRPLTLGTAAAGGPQAAHLAIGADTCSGATLAIDQSCTLDVTYTPGAEDALASVVSLPADVRGGSVAAALYGAVVDPPAPPRSLRLLAAYEGVVARWEPPAETDRPVAGYRLYEIAADGAPSLVRSLSRYDASVGVELADMGTRTYAMSTVISNTVEGPLSEGVSGASLGARPVAGPVSNQFIDLPGATGGPLAKAGNETTLRGPGWFVGLLGDTTWAEFTVRDPDGVIQPGSYTLLGTSGQPTVDSIYVTTRCASHSYDQLVVHEAAQLWNGAWARFAATATGSCNGLPMRLEWRHQSDTPLDAVWGAPDPVVGGTVQVGTTTTPTTTVTFRNDGSLESALGAATVPAHWTVAADACSNTTLAPGATCSVGVRYAPTAVGVHDGLLEVPDGTSHGPMVRLTGNATDLPGVPTDFTALPMVGRARLTWAPPADTGGTAVTGYRVYRGTSATMLAPVGPTAGTHFTDRYGAPGQRLYYAVQALNANGAGPRTEPVSFVVPGEELIYTSSSGSDQPYRMYARPLTPGGVPVEVDGDGADKADMTVSQDGTYVAWSKGPVGGDYSIVYQRTADLGAVAPVRLTGGPGYSDLYPTWSPDGKKLAFARIYNSSRIWSVWVYDFTARRLTKVPDSDYLGSPVWINNHELVTVFYGQTRRLYVLAANGRYASLIPGTDRAFRAAVSPDGSRIAFTTFEGYDTTPAPEAPRTERTALRVTWIGGGTSRVLASTGFNNDPAWSPDGSQVYWAHATRDATGDLVRDIYRVNANGTGRVQLTATPTLDEDDPVLHHRVVPTALPRVPRPAPDFTGDGRADPAFFRPYNGIWYVRGLTPVGHGTLGDVPVAADYNGDRKADIAVFRPSNSTWYVRGRAPVQYGAPGDIPVPADYNGDGRADIAVFRPSNGTWYVRGGLRVAYGRRGDLPVPADYNGDRKADLAVWRASARTYFVRNVATRTYGMPTYVPVPADYNGDGKVDIALHDLSGAWYVHGRPTVDFTTVPNEIPVPGNYVGTRAAEYAIVWPSQGMWYVGTDGVRFGARGDVPA